MQNSSRKLNKIYIKQKFWICTNQPKSKQCFLQHLVHVVILLDYSLSKADFVSSGKESIFQIDFCLRYNFIQLMLKWHFRLGKHTGINSTCKWLTNCFFHTHTSSHTRTHTYSYSYLLIAHITELSVILCGVVGTHFSTFWLKQILAYKSSLSQFLQVLDILVVVFTLH